MNDLSVGYSSNLSQQKTALQTEATVASASAMKGSLNQRYQLQSDSHLPLSWYFDSDVLAREQATLFARNPAHVGHRLMAPNARDYHVLEGTDGAWSLVNNGASIEMVSNICRHRQAIMLKGRGQTTGSIVCPLHRWTYDLKGELIGAPHFKEQPCLHLPRQALQEWNGLLFNPPKVGGRSIAQELANLGCASELTFDDYVFDSVEVTHYNFNWKTFIEVYLEDYHVEPFHPGLGHFVDCNNLKWEFGDHYSVQTVGLSQSLAKPGSPVYAKWHEVVKNFRNGEDPPHGAIWLTLYPNVMIEWYPHVLVVSTVHPNGPERCTNVVEFYYPEEIFHFEREFIEAERAAYAETAIEDEEICQRMHDGRRCLVAEGREEHGPYQSPLEDGLKHFHQWVRREIAV
jgi:choline monooxygenase